MNPTPAAVEALVERVKPLFDGHPPEVQGAALADLLAIWLVGHGVEGKPKMTDNLRKALLAMHVDSVRDLMKINERKAAS